MGYADKYITCIDCRADFIFTIGEQEYFARMNFINEPKRCPDCRKAKRARIRQSEEDRGPRLPRGPRR